MLLVELKRAEENTNQRKYGLESKKDYVGFDIYSSRFNAAMENYKRELGIPILAKLSDEERNNFKTEYKGLCNIKTGKAR